MGGVWVLQELVETDLLEALADEAVRDLYVLLERSATVEEHTEREEIYKNHRAAQAALVAAACCCLLLLLLLLLLLMLVSMLLTLLSSTWDVMRG